MQYGKVLSLLENSEMVRRQQREENKLLKAQLEKLKKYKRRNISEAARRFDQTSRTNKSIGNEKEIKALRKKAKNESNHSNKTRNRSSMSVKRSYKEVLKQLDAKDPVDKLTVTKYNYESTGTLKKSANHSQDWQSKNKDQMQHRLFIENLKDHTRKKIIGNIQHPMKNIENQAAREMISIQNLHHGMRM